MDSHIGDRFVDVYNSDSMSIELRIFKRSASWRVVEDMLGERA